MKIWVYTIAWNEAYMMPFFLRHYSKFADRIIVYDEHSTDGTRELVKACPLAELRDWPHVGLDDRKFLDAIHTTYPEARGEADWVMWPDVDELLYAPDVRAVLQENAHAHIIGALGQALISPTPVVDDGQSQIYELCRTGFKQDNEDKSITWQPHINVEFKVGRHEIKEARHHDEIVHVRHKFTLLHCHFINGWDASMARNQRNSERCAMIGEPFAAWSYMPGATGPSSNEWLAYALNNLTSVV